MTAIPAAALADLPISLGSFAETREQRPANGRRCKAARSRGEREVWIQVVVADADGQHVPHRRRLDLIEAEARYGEPTWTEARIDDRGRTRIRERGVWRSWTPAEAAPCRVRGRAPRAATNGRSRGSRRVASRSSGGGSSGDPDLADEPDGAALIREAP